MKVFAVTPLYPPHSRVGAWLATHEFLRALVDRGHDVSVMPWRNGPNEESELDGVRILPRRPGVPGKIDKADVVISHLGDNGIAHREAVARRVPSVRLVHSPMPDARRRLAGAALVVTNSKATLEALGWNRPAHICPPPTWPDRHAVAPGALVTLVNLSALKGGELFWRLAKAMPDVEFLGVEGGYGKQLLGQAPNVEVLPTQEDVREVWSRTRVLLMPSEREAWGMTGVEALCSGIPVIASPTPGLRESLGRAATFIDRNDDSGWQRMIRKLVTRPSSWQAMSSLALRRSRELLEVARASVERFCNAVESLA